MDKLTASAKSKKATDADVLRYKYMSFISSEVSKLYKQKREIQNSNLSNNVKYQQVREIQRQIDELTESALNAYESITIRGNTAYVGGVAYKKNSDGEWEKVRTSSNSSTNKLWYDDAIAWVEDFSKKYPLPKISWD